VKLNIGCGPDHLDDHTNIDMKPPADIVGDFMTMHFEDIDEIVMSHVLEHFPWRRTDEVLWKLRTWCRTGSKITVEVPDIVPILEAGVDFYGWQQLLFGEQSHAGEFHMAAFTARSLQAALILARFDIQEARRFRSEHDQRRGLPCIEVVAHAGH
jgi:hypothetical protein